jgi:GntR family transcriptional repressor for pyruvate dehydrogenase complex
MTEFKGSAATHLVVAHVRGMLDRGDFKPGDRLASERELAKQLGVSRPSLRAGLRSLAVMGVVRIRPGAGSYIAAGPPALGTDALSFQAALHGFTRDQMFEARLVLEVAVAGMAAERVTSDRLVPISDETTGMFASMDDPQAFLLHDIAFHRAVASACDNPILSSLVEMVSELFRQQRRETIGRAHDLKDAADEHRRIYLAIRAHDPDRARRTMSEHLDRAYRTQASEGNGANAGGREPDSSDALPKLMTP